MAKFKPQYSKLSVRSKKKKSYVMTKSVCLSLSMCDVVSGTKFLADSHEFRMGVLYENLSNNSECRGGRVSYSPTSLRGGSDFVPSFSTY
jgi:hypothetical protein